MANPTLEAVAARLDGLERQNLWLRWIAAGLAVVAIIAGVEAGLGGSRRPGTIEAERIVIRDKQGRVRARLGVDGADTTLVMFDHRGCEQINLGVAGADLSSLTFADAGQSRLMLQSSSDGAASLRFLDRNEKARALWFMAPDSATGLSFTNAKRGIAMGVDPAGRSAVFSTDEQGNENGRVGASAVTAESLGLYAGPNPSGAIPVTGVSRDRDERSTPVSRPPTPVTKSDASSDCDHPRASYRGALN